VEVSRDGKVVERMYPARWFFREREGEATTEVALRRGVAEDLYVVFSDFDAADQSAFIEVFVNPLVNWIWFGVGILILGTGLALLPERAFAFVTSKVPDGAVTTSLVLLAIVAGSATSAYAQHVEQPQLAIVAPQSALERELYDQIICMCGTCGRKRVGECTCPDAVRMRGEIAQAVATGKPRDEIIQAFVARYGSQEVLASPIDRGFNRLAWAVPYLLGIGGLVLAGAVAVRWSRRSIPAVAAASAGSTSDRALQDRLDDELRNLD
jgi:cytochrome c-type biogenesis protein CcmF